MNIQSYTMPDAAYFFPHTYGSMDGINGAVWTVGFFLFDSKFITLFSMLFGAGICLMTDRAAARGARVARLHYRRMLVLLGIGYVHAYLFWVGDVLVTYALCGMLIYPLRRLRWGWLVVIALVLFCIGAGLSVTAGLTAPEWPADNRADMLESFAPTAEKIERTVQLHREGGLELLAKRAGESFFMQTFLYWFSFVWRDSAMMLLGMAFFKLGLLSGRRSRRTYAVLAVVGLVAGLFLVRQSLIDREAVDWEVFHTFFISSEYNSGGAALVAIGYLGVLSLLIKSFGIWRPLAAVGRMALTNYLTHTLVFTTIMSGPIIGTGWTGLHGRFSRLEQLGMVALMWTVQLIVSPWWMKRFHFGPAEWVWRSLTYGKRQPFRR
jgi:uncharacterized protein